MFFVFYFCFDDAFLEIVCVAVFRYHEHGTSFLMYVA